MHAKFHEISWHFCQAAGEPRPVFSVDFDPSIRAISDEKSLLSSQSDQICDSVANRLPLCDKFNAWPLGPDCYRIATTGGDSTVRVWKLDCSDGIGSKMTFLCEMKHQSSVNCVRFSPKGGMLAACDDSGMIFIWVQSKPAHPTPSSFVKRNNETQTVLMQDVPTPPSLTQAEGEVGQISPAQSESDDTAQQMESVPMNQSQQCREEGETDPPMSISSRSHNKQSPNFSITTPKTQQINNLSQERSEQLQHSTQQPKDNDANYNNNSLSDVNNLEEWRYERRLPAHRDDVYDLCWSPDGRYLLSGSIDNTICVFNVETGALLQQCRDHKQFVQGVAWNPLGHQFVSMSSDRTCRVYSVSRNRKSKRMFTPICCISHREVSKTLSDQTENRKNQELQKQDECNTTTTEFQTDVPSQAKERLFVDETKTLYFRRPSFSPDGSLFICPAGTFKDSKGLARYASYIFRSSMPATPILRLPSQMPSIAARFCPQVFEARPGQGIFTSLPYRMVFAVATKCAVLIYDTHQQAPLAMVSGTHKAPLTDVAWSYDGRTVMITSEDGYCSSIHFSNSELGKPIPLPSVSEPSSEESSTKSTSYKVGGDLQNQQKDEARPKSGQKGLNHRRHSAPETNQTQSICSNVERQEAKQKPGASSEASSVCEGDDKQNHEKNFSLSTVAASNSPNSSTKETKRRIIPVVYVQEPSSFSPAEHCPKSVENSPYPNNEAKGNNSDTANAFQLSEKSRSSLSSEFALAVEKTDLSDDGVMVDTKSQPAIFGFRMSGHTAKESRSINSSQRSSADVTAMIESTHPCPSTHKKQSQSSVNLATKKPKRITPMLL